VLVLTRTAELLRTKLLVVTRVTKLCELLHSNEVNSCEDFISSTQSAEYGCVDLTLNRRSVGTFLHP